MNSTSALPVYAKDSWRRGLAAACAAHAVLGPASLVRCDVSTLYFDADQGDGFREPGFPKERRLERRSPWGCTARHYRTIQIRAGQHILTAEDPLPPDLRDVLALIK